MASTRPPSRANSASPTAWYVNTWYGRCSIAVNRWISSAMTNPGTSCSSDIESADIERDPAHVAAAEWFVRLQGAEVSLEDTLAWQAWLNESPGNARAFARIEAVSQAVRSVPVPRPVAAARLAADRYDASVPLKDWKASRAARWPWMTIALAAVCAGIAVATV